MLMGGSPQPCLDACSSPQRSAPVPGMWSALTQRVLAGGAKGAHAALRFQTHRGQPREPWLAALCTLCRAASLRQHRKDAVAARRLKRAATLRPPWLSSLPGSAGAGDPTNPTPNFRVPFPAPIPLVLREAGSNPRQEGTGANGEEGDGGARSALLALRNLWSRMRARD